MLPSVLQPISMTTLARCTAMLVPRTMSPCLTKSPALMLASNKLAKFSDEVVRGSAALPGERRAVGVWVDMGWGKSSRVRGACEHAFGVGYLKPGSQGAYQPPNRGFGHGHVARNPPRVKGSCRCRGHCSKLRISGGTGAFSTTVFLEGSTTTLVSQAIAGELPWESACIT